MPWMAGLMGAGGAAGAGAAGTGAAAGAGTAAATGAGVGAASVAAPAAASVGAGASIGSAITGSAPLVTQVANAAPQAATAVGPSTGVAPSVGASQAQQPGLMSSLLNRYLGTEGEFGEEQISGLVQRAGKSTSQSMASLAGVENHALPGPPMSGTSNLPENRFKDDDDDYMQSVVDEYLRGSAPYYG